MLDGGTVSVLHDTTLLISSFGQDEAGELLVVGHGGTVHRIVSEQGVSQQQDFNNDSHADILWRHSSGVIHIWFMTAGVISRKATPGTVPSDWTIQRVGDFNNDGHADILWRHASGVIHIWFMTAGVIRSTSDARHCAFGLDD